jgi:hypothetical protein
LGFVRVDVPAIVVAGYELAPYFRGIQAVVETRTILNRRLSTPILHPIHHISNTIAALPNNRSVWEIVNDLNDSAESIATEYDHHRAPDREDVSFLP